MNCCMRPDCADTHCPGVALARMFIADGGARVSGDDHVRLPPPRQQHQLKPPEAGWLAAVAHFFF